MEAKPLHPFVGAATALVILGTAIPAHAGHPHSGSGDYLMPLGVGIAGGGEVGAAVFCVPDGCADPDPLVPPIGGAIVWAERDHKYRHADVTGQDFTNAPLPLSACIYPEGGEGICPDGNYSGDPTCGNIAKVRGVEKGPRLTTWVRVAWVEGTSVCFGTQGGVDVGWISGDD